MTRVSVQYPLYLPCSPQWNLDEAIRPVLTLIRPAQLSTIPMSVRLMNGRIQARGGVPQLPMRHTRILEIAYHLLATSCSVRHRRQIANVPDVKICMN